MVDFLVSQGLLSTVLRLAGGALWTTGLRACSSKCRALVAPPEKYEDEEDMLQRSAFDGDVGECQFALDHGACRYLLAMSRAARLGNTAVFYAVASHVDCETLSHSQINVVLSGVLRGGSSRLVEYAKKSFKDSFMDEIDTVLDAVKFDPIDSKTCNGMRHISNEIYKNAVDGAAKLQYYRQSTYKFFYRLDSTYGLFMYFWGLTGSDEYKRKAEELEMIIKARSDGTDTVAFTYTLEDPCKWAMAGAAATDNTDRCLILKDSYSGQYQLKAFVCMGAAAASAGHLSTLQLAYEWLGIIPTAWIYSAVDGTEPVQTLRWIMKRCMENHFHWKPRVTIPAGTFGLTENTLINGELFTDIAFGQSIACCSLLWQLLPGLRTALVTGAACDAALCGDVDLCSYAIALGARNFRAMINAASQAFQTSMIGFIIRNAALHTVDTPEDQKLIDKWSSFNLFHKPIECEGFLEKIRKMETSNV